VRVALGVVAVLALVVATSAAPSTPKVGCSTPQTVALVKRFVTAFNHGDRSVLNNRLWSGKAYFNWYAVTAEPGMRVDPEARRRDTLMRYFAARHAASERLVLEHIEVNGVSGGGYRNFEFHMRRAADDLPAGPVAYDGKGASSCATGRLTTWVMGARPS
jgi:hypothetical protein